MNAAQPRLLVFNLATDADDPAFGFTTLWLRALAARCQAIDVLTMRAGRLDLPPNVRVFSVGKEKGYSEARRALVFYRLLAGLLLRRRYDACFAHMNHIFALMAAPLLKLRRVPVTLWYAHRAVSRSLRWAERWVDVVVTASPESFRLPSRKTRLIGHGIDTARFAPVERLPGGPFTLVTVGRLAPVKNLETLLDAARRLADNPDWRGLRVRIVGEAENAAYATGLRERAAALGLGDVIAFEGAVRYDDAPAAYQRADVMVNLSATGSLDKAALEAMACGLPVVTSNEAFAAMLAPWGDLLAVPPGSPDALAASLARLRHLPPEARRALGLELRALVERDHSLERLADKLVSIFQEAR